MDFTEPSPGRLPLREHLARLLFLFTASYGMLYYSYKYFSPTLLGGDSTYYYPMYQAPLNFHVAQSPFVLRQIGAVLTYLVWRCHIYYPNHVAFDGVGIDQHLFFAALFVNWCCLVLTAMVAGFIAEKMLGARNVPLFAMAALLCLLSFHAQVAVLIDTAEGPAWLLMSLAFLTYLCRSRLWLVVALILAIFQREMVLLAIGSLATLELLSANRRQRFAAFAMGVSLACFAIYLVLRRHLGGGWEFQSHPASLIKGLREIPFSTDLLFQALLVQNIVFIALGAFWMAKRKPVSVRFWMPKFLATFAFLALAALGSFEGNTTGRLAGLLTPIFASMAALGFAAMQGDLPAEDSRCIPESNRPAFAVLVAFAVLLPVLKIYQVVGPKPIKHHPRVSTRGNDLKAPADSQQAITPR